jgi:RNA polymerase sigma factor (sigma-70 family)
MDDKINEYAWALIAKHYSTLRRMAMAAADYDTDLADEYMSDCVYAKMAHVADRWLNGPRLQPFEHYMHSMFYWYLRKHRARIRKMRIRFNSPNEDQKEPSKIESNIHVEVSTMLDSLQPRDRQMVELIYFQSYTYQECADALDISIGHVSGRMKRILRRLKQNNPEWEN